ncbi:hypothetical protein [Salmonella sp. S146_54837]|nr:hypothetical protein [Salmonella sp. S146_54837]
MDNKKINKWPAVNLAANRKPNAIGWAIKLKVSIQTIRGIKNDGVPCGTK